MPVAVETLAHHHIGSGNQIVDRDAVREVESLYEISGQGVVKSPLSGGIGLEEVEDRIELLDLRPDELRGILGEVRVGRDDDGDRLSDVPNSVNRKRRLERKVSSRARAREAESPTVRREGGRSRSRCRRRPRRCPRPQR
jgi:hypothetical protein